jgi:hypothetical protein
MECICTRIHRIQASEFPSLIKIQEFLVRVTRLVPLVLICVRQIFQSKVVPEVINFVD